MKRLNRLGLLIQLTISFSLCIFLSGCWDRQDIEERAVVLSIGIDHAGTKGNAEESSVTHIKGKRFDSNDEVIRIILQIAVPGRIPLGTGEGIGGGGGQSTVWIVDGVGHTIGEAINNLQQRVSQPFFFGHLRVIVISEQVAKNGLNDVEDYLRRNSEIRRMTWMVVCEGEASTIMRAEPQLGRVPSLYLVNTMNQSVKMGRFPNDFIGIFWSSLSAKGKDGFLPFIKMSGQNAVEISGLALFKDDKLVDRTEALEIPLYMGIVGLNPAGGQAFIELPNSADKILFGTRHRKATIKTEMRNGKPLIRVHISLEGNILEKQNRKIIINSQILTQLEETLEKSAIKRYIALIERTQAKQSDIFGFGEYIRAKQPRYWSEEVKTRDDWHTIYKTIPVEVTLHIKIRRVGMKSK